jgi:hypothetical protein
MRSNPVPGIRCAILAANSRRSASLAARDTLRSGVSSPSKPSLPRGSGNVRPLCRELSTLEGNRRKRQAGNGTGGCSPMQMQFGGGNLGTWLVRSWYRAFTSLPSLPLLALPSAMAAPRKIYAGMVRTAALASATLAQRSPSFLERTPRRFVAAPDSRRFRNAHK